MQVALSTHSLGGVCQDEKMGFKQKNKTHKTFIYFISLNEAGFFLTVNFESLGKLLSLAFELFPGISYKQLQNKTTATSSASNLF